MKRKLTGGLTGVTLSVFILDTSSSTGAGLGSLVFNSSGLVAEYRRQGQASWTAISLQTATLGTWASGGFIADGALTGAYEIGIPDAAVAAGARWVNVRLRGATNMYPCQMEIEIDVVNYQSATAFITGVNSLAPPTNWNLSSIDSNGRLDLIKIAGTTQTARDLGTSVLLSSGTGTGQVSLSSGTVTVGTNNDKTGYTASTVSDKTGYTVSTVSDKTGYTVSTVSDKTGYSLSSGGVQAIWDALTSALTTAGSVGLKLKNWVLGTDSKALLSADAQTGAVLPRVTLVDTLTTYTGNTVQTGDSYARLGAPVGASLSVDVAGVQSDTDNIQTRLPAALVGGNIPAQVAAYASGQTPLQPTVAGNTLDVSSTGEAGLDFNNIKDAASSHTLTNITVPAVTATATATALGTQAKTDVENAVLDGNVSSSHTTAGSAGHAINSASTATDPWSTALPGSYSAGSAGNILGSLPSASAIATAIMAYAVETGQTLQTVLQKMAAESVGNYDSTTGTFKAVGNGGTTRVTAVLTPVGDPTLNKFDRTIS